MKKKKKKNRVIKQAEEEKKDAVAKIPDIKIDAQVKKKSEHAILMKTVEYVARAFSANCRKSMYQN